MKQLTKYLTFACILLLIQSCQKYNNTKKNNCDFTQADSEHIKDENDVVFPLFTKYYDNKTGKVNKINIGFRNIATGAATFPSSLYLIYKGSDLILLKDNIDTVAILSFNSNGQLYKAEGVPYIYGWDQKVNYRFIYTGNNLTEIQWLDYTDWTPYVQLQYDNTNKNISKLYFKGLSTDNNRFIDYTYNYSKKAKGQCYPDEMYGDYHYFWYLIKYLDIIPNLQPQNVLMESYFSNNDYPGDMQRKYSGHQFDKSGNLIHYKMDLWKANTENGVLYYFDQESWNISWSCY